MEVWKDIKGYEGLYQASTLGRVKSFNFKTEKILKPSIDRGGYHWVKLYKNKIKKLRNIHRLVAETFIPNILNKREVNHKDGNKKNNTITNLEWVSSKENQIHSHKSGLNKGPQGEKAAASKLKEKEVLEIRGMYGSGNFTHQQIAELFNVTKTNIGYIIRRDSWSHI